MRQSTSLRRQSAPKAILRQSYVTHNLCYICIMSQGCTVLRPVFWPSFTVVRLLTVCPTGACVCNCKFRLLLVYKPYCMTKVYSKTSPEISLGLQEKAALNGNGTGKVPQQSKQCITMRLAESGPSRRAMSRRAFARPVRLQKTAVCVSRAPLLHKAGSKQPSLSGSRQCTQSRSPFFC